MTDRLVSLDDYRTYVNRALDAMCDILRELGDARVNRRADRPGANSPYVLVTHCLGVMEYWGGHIVAGRTVERDRAAEFRASGTVEPLLERVRRSRERFEQDLAGARPGDGPRGEPDPDDLDRPEGRTQGGALLHVYEELAQHLGQLEITRDLIVAGGAGGPLLSAQHHP